VSTINERLLETFRLEATDLLLELDEALMALERAPEDAGLVNQVFRAMHTLKGSGASVGLRRLVDVAHHLETIFGAVREDRLVMTSEVIDVALRGCDLVGTLLYAEDAELHAAACGALATRLGQLLPLVEIYTGDRTGPLNVVHYFDEEEVAADATPTADLFPREVVRDFVDEGEELGQAIGNALLALEKAPGAQDQIDELFRDLHSLKGNAGIVISQKRAALAGDHPIVRIYRLAHALETLVGEARAATPPQVSPAGFDRLLAGADLLRLHVAGLDDPALLVDVELAAFERFGIVLDPRGRAASVAPRSLSSRVPVFAEEGRSVYDETVAQGLAALEGCLRGLDDPGAGPADVGFARRALHALRTLFAAARHGRVEEAARDLAALIDAIEARVSAGVVLDPAVAARLRAVPAGIGAALRDRPAAASAPVVARRGATAAMAAIAARRGSTAEFAAVTAESSSVTPSPVAAVAPVAPVAEAKATGHGSVRVDQEKLDLLMRVVGELLAVRGTFPAIAGRLATQHGLPGLAKEVRDAGAHFARLADDLQGTVMSLRMLPIRTVLQKFPRMVRDLARGLGKEIELVLRGEETELDKTILEKIGDPLVHTIRNAVDHGVEDPATRVARGKPATGTITVTAYTEAGHVVVEVSDDGKGADPQVIRRKAVEKGLLTAEAAEALDDARALELLFEPGFSTAAAVTDVSGRGVGMDVVRSAVRGLHGAVTIDNQPGLGMKVTFKLPMSLIVSRGIVVQIAGGEYLVPLDSVVELVKVPAADIHGYQGQELAMIRGRLCALLALPRLFGGAARVAEAGELAVAVLEAGGARFGVIVDRFVGEAEALVKPLDARLASERTFLGTTIMGDGRVLLVVNPEQLAKELGGGGARAQA
jgi:two-component system chemotaxis sensor kinase CheA